MPQTRRAWSQERLLFKVCVPVAAVAYAEFVLKLTYGTKHRNRGRGSEILWFRVRVTATATEPLYLFPRQCLFISRRWPPAGTGRPREKKEKKKMTSGSELHGRWVQHAITVVAFLRERRSNMCMQYITPANNSTSGQEADRARRCVVCVCKPICT